MSDQCPNCGGAMIGDGYTSVRHCENAEDLDASAEADSGPIHCSIQVLPTDMLAKLFSFDAETQGYTIDGVYYPTARMRVTGQSTFEIVIPMADYKAAKAKATVEERLASLENRVSQLEPGNK